MATGAFSDGSSACEPVRICNCTSLGPRHQDNRPLILHLQYDLCPFGASGWYSLSRIGRHCDGKSTTTCPVVQQCALLQLARVCVTLSPKCLQVSRITARPCSLADCGNTFFPVLTPRTARLVAPATPFCPMQSTQPLLPPLALLPSSSRAQCVSTSLVACQLHWPTCCQVSGFADVLTLLDPFSRRRTRLRNHARATLSPVAISQFNNCLLPSLCCAPSSRK